MCNSDNDIVEGMCQIYRERLIYNELIIMLKGDATHAKEIKVRRWIDKEDGGGIHHKTIQYREREKNDRKKRSLTHFCPLRSWIIT